MVWPLPAVQQSLGLVAINIVEYEWALADDNTVRAMHSLLFDTSIMALSILFMIFSLLAADNLALAIVL